MFRLAGEDATPPSKMIVPLEVVIVPVLLPVPVISVCAFRTETVPVLVKLPTI